MSFIVISSPFKRFPIQNRCFYDFLDVHIMDELENDTFSPHVHIVYLLYLKRMLVSAAACAPADRVLNKTSPGTVSFFIDRV